MAVWPDLDPPSRTQKVTSLFERYNQGIFSKDSTPYQGINVPTLKGFLSHACPRPLTDRELKRILRDCGCPEGKHWLNPHQATDAISAALLLCLRSPEPLPEPKRRPPNKNGRVVIYNPQS